MTLEAYNNHHNLGINIKIYGKNQRTKKRRILPNKKQSAQISRIANLLANIDSPVDEKNLVTYAINGLFDKYEGVAGIIRHRDTTPTFAQAQSMLLLDDSLLNHMSSRHPARDSSASSPHVLLAASNNRNNNNSAQLCRNFQHGSCSFGERCKYVHSNPAGARNGNNNNRPSAAQWNNITSRVMHGYRITISPTRPPKMSYAPEPGTIPNPINPTPTWTSPPPQYHPTVTPFGSRGVIGPAPGQAHVVQPTTIGSSGPSSYTTGPPPGTWGPQAVYEPYVDQATTPRLVFNAMMVQDYGDSGWYMETGATSYLASNTGKLTSISNKSTIWSILVGNGNSIPVINSEYYMSL
nr:hypothetical protein [Tanacetum cinerariifolium]